MNIDARTADWIRRARNGESPYGVTPQMPDGIPPVVSACTTLRGDPVKLCMEKGLIEWRAINYSTVKLRPVTITARAKSGLIEWSASKWVANGDVQIHDCVRRSTNEAKPAGVDAWTVAFRVTESGEETVISSVRGNGEMRSDFRVIHPMSMPGGRVRANGEEHCCKEDEIKGDVVFIHGLGGDARETWMNDPNNPKTFWPDWLQEDLPGISVISHNYEAQPLKSIGALMSIGDRALNMLHALSVNGLGQRPLVFVTHSLGGLLVKEMLRQADFRQDETFQALARSTVGIVFIATPHHGSDWGGLVRFISQRYGLLNDKVQELKCDSAHLQQLNDWFASYVERRREAQAPLMVESYCETKPLKWNHIELGVVVGRVSASSDPHVSVIPLPEDHVSICKPSARTEQLYLGIKRFVSKAITIVSRE